MRVADIDRELDLAQKEGPVRDIIIPPCPELLAELQLEVRKGDPDPLVIARIAGSDVAMAYIARQLYGVDADMAQTCGLFCHVGIPVMLQGVRGYAGTLAEALARQDRSFTETENAAHRTDHAVVGAIVARTWRLPSVISIAVRLHHDFTALRDQGIPAEVRTLVAITLIAEYLVSTHEGVTEHKEWETHGLECLSHLQINESEVDVWVDALHPVFEGVVVA